MMQYREIYADFLKHCRPTPLPTPWSQFAKNVDFWKPPKDEWATLEALQQQHDSKDLLRSRLVVCGIADEHNQQGKIPAGNKLTINSILTGSFSRILPLRTSPQCLPSDLLTGEGTVSGRLPACAVLHDCLVQTGIQQTGFVCLAFSMQDMMALRAIGIPAVLASGLEQITRKSLEDFSSSLGLELPVGSFNIGAGHNAPPTAPLVKKNGKENQVTSPWDFSNSGADCDLPTITRPRLFLVGWSPSQRSLRRPSEWDGVLDSLISAARFLDVDLDDVFVWRPAEEDLQRIVFCLSKGSRKHVRKAIKASLRRNSKLVSHTQEDVKDAENLQEIRARLRDALLRPGVQPGERRRCLRRHQRAIEDLFVTPFLEQAAAELDPQKRSQLAGLAGINQLVHPAAEVYLAKREKDLANRGLRAQPQSNEIKDLMKMYDILFKFVQASEEG